ncbi:MAG: HAD family acid phosphatase [Pseudomonadota bacterium]
MALSRFFLVILSVLLPILLNSQPAIEETSTHAPDLYTVQQSLMQYHDNGQYEHEIQMVVDKAKKHLETRIAQKQQRPLAIVLDIDETALSNWQELKTMQFHYDKNYWLNWEQSKQAIAIKPILDLYYYALDNHIHVFFITAREESVRKVTEDNLKQAGYTSDNIVYFTPENNPYKNSADYKTAMRKKITDQGYDIVLSIGDQYSDLCGGYADALVKLSNPFYYIPGCIASP